MVGLREEGGRDRQRPFYNRKGIYVLVAELAGGDGFSDSECSFLILPGDGICTLKVEQVADGTPCVLNHFLNL